MWIVRFSSLWTALACSAASFPFSIFVANHFSDHQANSRWLWFCGALVLIAFGFYALIAQWKWDTRQEAIRSRDDAKQAADEADNPWKLENFVTYFETPVIQLAAEKVACWVHSIPREDLRELRMDIMAAISNSVGRTNSPGTRANIFEFSKNKDGAVELVNTEYFKGRGRRSVSKFGPSDPTFKMTLSNTPRFEPNAGKDYEYETYMTMPIVAGPNDFYGALTVDALKTGQLDEQTDQPIMRYWAALLALTYAFEGFHPVKGYCGEPD